MFIVMTWTGWAITCIIALAALLWKVRARSPAGVQRTPDFEPFLGGTRRQLQVVVKGGMSLADYQLSVARKCGWKPFGWGHVAGKHGAFILHPKDVRHLLRDNFSSFVKDNDVLDVLLGSGIFNTDGDEWKHQRVASAGLFSRRKLRDRMSTVFGTHAQDLARCFKKHADEGTVVDAQRLLYCYTFDGINRVAFNKNVDSLRGDEDDLAFQAAFDSALNICTERFLTPWWPIMRMLNIGFEKQLSNDMKVIESYIYNVVDGYFNEQGQVRDEVLADDGSLVALFLEHGREEGVTYTKKYLRDMILNAVIAGRDTTGSATTSCIEFLCAHRDWQDKVRAEARQVFGGNLQEALTFDDVSGTAPITEAVFMEAIRLHPPVPINEKRVAKTSTLPSGITLEEGCFISYSPHLTNRHPEVWGEDSEEFKPERWMDGKAKQYDDYMFPTFNAGPRLCLGKEMAILEGKIALLTLFAQYEFSMEPGFEPQQQLAVTRLLKNGLRVRVSHAE